MIPHAVYTNGQMLEIHSQNCHFRHFSGSSARLPGGKAHSATHCSIMGSDMTRARPGRPRSEWVWVHRNCHTEFRRLFTLSDGSEWHPIGTNWRYGPHLIPAPQVACPGLDLSVTRRSSFLNHARTASCAHAKPGV